MIGSNLWCDSSSPLYRRPSRFPVVRMSKAICFSHQHYCGTSRARGWARLVRILKLKLIFMLLFWWKQKRKVDSKNNKILPAISFSAERASHLSSRYLWSSLSDLIRRSIFGSKNFRNILLAFAEINLKSFGVRLIGNDELVHCKYFRYLGSSVAAFCHGRHPCMWFIFYVLKRRSDFFIWVSEGSEKEREKWNQFYEKSFFFFDVFVFLNFAWIAHEKWGKNLFCFAEGIFSSDKARQFETLWRGRRTTFFLRSQKTFFPSPPSRHF